MNYNTLKHIVDDKTKFYIVIIRWIKIVILMSLYT